MLEFLFGTGDYVSAVIPWLALATAAPAIPGIVGMFRKKPKAPKIPDYQELLTPEQEQEMFDLWSKNIGRDVSSAVGASRANLAGRGMFRSGTTGRVEADIRKAGVDIKASKMMDWILGKAHRRADWAGRQFGAKESRYGAELGQYYGEQAAGGAGMGQAASNWFLLEMMKKYKPV